MSWEREVPPKGNQWQIPAAEVVIHEETVAVEDLNIYPENLTLLPAIVQSGHVHWEIQIRDMVQNWLEDQGFYAAPGGWLGGFYAVSFGWVDAFYAVPGGWVENHEFYALPGGWIGGFYAIPGGWIADNAFYAVPSGWLEGFYALAGGWVEGFYSAYDGWYLDSGSII